ncbi:MAG: hypothetical protein ABI446_00475 [Gemmatimonadaceae bacterium]
MCRSRAIGSAKKTDSSTACTTSKRRPAIRGHTVSASDASSSTVRHEKPIGMLRTPGTRIARWMASPDLAMV